MDYLHDIKLTEEEFKIALEIVPEKLKDEFSQRYHTGGVTTTYMVRRPAPSFAPSKTGVEIVEETSFKMKDAIDLLETLIRTKAGYEKYKHSYNVTMVPDVISNEDCETLIKIVSKYRKL